MTTAPNAVKAKPQGPEAHPDHPELAVEHIEEGNELGTVQIHNSVIATIARLAAVKVPGVLEMSGGFVDGLAGMIGKKQGDRGIRVEVDEHNVSIEMHVILEYGVRIPHVAWQLQTEVRQAVEQMTGKAVKTVQIVVDSVRILQDKRQDALEEGQSPT